MSLDTPTNVVSQFDYTYDAAGRRVSIAKSGSAFGDLSGSVDAYTYNARSELTSARRTKNGQPIPGFSEDFDYDPIGNRRSSSTYNEKGEAQTSTYEANNLNQYTSRTTPGYAAVRGEADPNATVTVNENPTFRLGSYYFGSDLFDNSSFGGLANLETYAVLREEKVGGGGEEENDLVSVITNQVYIAQSPETFAYDDDGNQTLITTKTGLWRVTYNGENRPIRWERESDNTTIVMSYDHMGRRREKNAQRFFYDGYLQVCSYGSPTPTLNSNCYIWDPTEPIATRPLVWNRDSYASYYTHDGNKNVSEVIASESEIFAHYEYAPFGANPLQYGISAADNPWRFSSDYADCDVALIYYNFRNYEPFSGGWVSRDPVDEVGGRRWFLRNSIELETEQLNLYQMVRSNPIENIDILGESGCRCGPEIGDILVKTLRRVENDFNNLRKRSILRAWWICTGIHLATTWDIDFDFISMPDGCAENECKDTFSVNGQCYNKWEINYILFGKISKLCDICRIQMEAMIAAHKIVAKPIIQTFSEEEYEWEYTHGVREWARIGRNMDGSLPQTLPNVDEKYSSCKSCDKKLEGWSNGFLTTWP